MPYIPNYPRKLVSHNERGSSRDMIGTNGRVNPRCQAPRHHEAPVSLDRLSAEVMGCELESVHGPIDVRLHDVQVRLRWSTAGI